MIPLDEARAHVLARCSRLEARRVQLRQAVGLVTAEAVVAAELVPPFDNTAVDGFAVRAIDTAGAADDAPVRLVVVDTLPAGAAPGRPVGPGEAIRIMTGAPMPAGADSVVMVEWTVPGDGDGDGDGDEVLVGRAVAPGDHVRRAGDDLQPGDAVFEPGTVLSAGHLGVLASLGRYAVEVIPRARVGVFSTGDELVEGDQPLAPGQIRDSNRWALLAMLDELGCEPVDLGLLPDDESAIRAAVEAGVEGCDALLTSGGVSMGDFDYVKKVLDEVGEMRWMQVAIKPAKPLAFGLVAGTPVFGLPGNPVSSMVSFELFARPALLQMMGHLHIDRTLFAGTAAEALRRRPDGKTHFARVRVERSGDDWLLSSSGGQGSHQLAAMAGADALAVITDGEGVDAGSPVPFFFLGATRWR